MSNEPKFKIVTKASYLPGDNQLIIETVDDFKKENVTAAFCFGFYENKLVFAYNQRRGIEIPGGHVEENEDVKEAAIRELYEETGAVIENISPVIRFTHHCFFEKPEDYKYPYPESYMEFFVGKVRNIEEYIENDECRAPVLIEMCKRDFGIHPVLVPEQVLIWDTFCKKNPYFLHILRYVYERLEEMG